eukprot:4155279-Pleurochrysis_carterae.AAC.1
MQRRADLLQVGRMHGGAEQAQPRYLQVYIDDFTGVALMDEVPEPAEVAATRVDPVHTRAGGGVPAAPHTRAHVHARLAVAGLARVGLYAAPSK